MHLWQVFSEITIFVHFNKTCFRLFSLCFPQESPFLSVDNVDNSVHKSFYSHFYHFFVWITCEHIKEWLLLCKIIPALFCAYFSSRDAQRGTGLRTKKWVPNVTHLKQSLRKSFSLIRHFDMSHWKQWSLSLMCWRERSVHCQHKDPHDQNSTQYLPAVHCWVPRHHIPGFSKLMKNAEGLHQNYCTHSWQNQSSPYRL